MREYVSRVREYVKKTEEKFGWFVEKIYLCKRESYL